MNDMSQTLAQHRRLAASLQDRSQAVALRFLAANVVAEHRFKVGEHGLEGSDHAGRRRIRDRAERENGLDDQEVDLGEGHVVGVARRVDLEDHELGVGFFGEAATDRIEHFVEED